MHLKHVLTDVSSLLVTASLQGTLIPSLSSFMSCYNLFSSPTTDMETLVLILVRSTSTLRTPTCMYQRKENEKKRERGRGRGEEREKEGGERREGENEKRTEKKDY